MSFDRKVWYLEKLKNRPLGVCSRFPDCINLTDGIHKLCSHHREKSLTYKNTVVKLKPKEIGVCRVVGCSNLAKPERSRCEHCATREARLALAPACKKRRAERRQEVKADVMNAYGGKCQCCGETDMVFLTIDHVFRYTGEGPRSGNPLYLWLKSHKYPDGYRVLCQSCNFALGKFGYCPHGSLRQPFKERSVQERTIKLREPQRLRNLKLKLAAFNAYGGVHCCCCGESHHECLTLDHIHNDGAQHRKELDGVPIYKWLKDKRYPAGFQVLCLNCNCAKRDVGVCPHKHCVSEVSYGA